ncbi:unnamed protein product [Closterium sp. Yama58-4]|nr:unnamed protein product [Closterium sp. Yama58-4]
MMQRRRHLSLAHCASSSCLKEEQHSLDYSQPATTNSSSSNRRCRRRVRCTARQLLLLTASCLAALSFVRTASAGLSGNSVPLDATQVPALQDCQTEWNVVMPAWSAGENCAVATFDPTEAPWTKPRGILCDDNGKVIALSMPGEQLQGSLHASLGSLAQLAYLSLGANQLRGSLPAVLSTLTGLTMLNVSGNYLTGPILDRTSMPASARYEYSNNYFTGDLQQADCAAPNLKLSLKCFSTPAAAAAGAGAPAVTCAAQRLPVVCVAFCGMNGTTTPVCNGMGLCYLDGPSLAPTCLCLNGAVQDGRSFCAPPGSVKRRELVAPTILTKGTDEATAGVFTPDPLPLFTYRTVPTGCGTDLPFRVEFTFFMFPTAIASFKGANGLAFVISATNAVGTGGAGGGVGYAGMDGRSIAVEFDTFTDAAHKDLQGDQVGLNTKGNATSVKAVLSPFRLNNQIGYTAWIDYKPGGVSGGLGNLKVYLAAGGDKPDAPLLERNISLCAILQPTSTDASFYFGFVASSVGPYQQQHAILASFIETGLTVPSPSRAVSITPAFGLTVSPSTFRPVGASPFTRYVSASYTLSGQQDAWLLRDPTSWDVTWLKWPVKDQDACNACWAYAVVASVEAAYGIATKKPAPQLSVDSLFAAMGLTTEDAKCADGGSPTEAFEKLLTLPKGGLTLTTNATYYPIQGFERTRFKGYVGLMLAVQGQPVVVHIQASAPTFAAYDGTYKYQDPACYTGELNHVVLVVGYSVAVGDSVQKRIPPPFWIIRNSWGADWGYNGHMRMDIQGLDGVCGINVLPGIYPIIKIPKDPCGKKSFKADQDVSTTFNPCGRFKCKPFPKTDTNSCNKCILPKSAIQPFVEVPNGFGSNICVYVDVCGSQLKNPCAVGTCINDGKGSYSCICPSNYVPTQTVDGFPTCDPADSLATSLAVSGSNWACSDVQPLMGLTSAEFMQQNPALDCSKPLLLNAVIQLGGSPVVPCTAFFYALSGDTCDSISTMLNRSQSDLLSLNPGLSCEQGIKAGRSVCVERNPDFTFTVPECLKFATLTVKDTCAQLLARTGDSGEVKASSWDELYRNNPGLACSNNVSTTTSALGSSGDIQVCLKADYWSFTLGRCTKGRSKSVSPSLTCSGAYAFYGGTSGEAAAMFSDYNGNACAKNVGSKYICVPR